jgi:hypothetical protein
VVKRRIEAFEDSGHKETREKVIRDQVIRKKENLVTLLPG